MVIYMSSRHYTARQILDIAVSVGGDNLPEYLNAIEEGENPERAAEIRSRIAAAVATGFITRDENTGDFTLTEKGVAFAA